MTPNVGFAKSRLKSTRVKLWSAMPFSKLMRGALVYQTAPEYRIPASSRAPVARKDAADHDSNRNDGTSSTDEVER
jgi:hypothetical protein